MRQSKHDTTFDRAPSEEREIVPSNLKHQLNEDLDIDPLDAVNFEEQLLRKQNQESKIQHSDNEENEEGNSFDKEDYEKKLLEEQNNKIKMKRTNEEKDIKKEVGFKEENKTTDFIEEKNSPQKLINNRNNETKPTVKSKIHPPVSCTNERGNDEEKIKREEEEHKQREGTNYISFFV